jgi:CubicO group peptidase (beta-lactamase class C family)
MIQRLPSPLDGWCESAFTSTAQVLALQLSEGAHHGVALTVYHRGRLVIDAWGGRRGVGSSRGWDRDTMAVGLSATKGISSLALHMAVERNTVSYDASLADFWPEVADRRVTIRHVLAHQAGLAAIRHEIPEPFVMADWDRMRNAVARQRPAWTPGTRNGYHGLTFGWLVGELVRRIDGRPLSRFVEQEISKPLELDGCYLSTPAEEHSRVAPLRVPRTGAHQRLSKSRQNDRGSMTLQALLPLEDVVSFVNSSRGLTACAPAFNGVFTARSLARVYCELERIARGRDGIVNEATLKQAAHPQNPRRPDLVLKYPVQWTLGYMHKVGSTVPSNRAFGMAGFAGSVGGCDPEAQLAFGLVCDQVDTSGFGARRTEVVFRELYETLAR